MELSKILGLKDNNSWAYVFTWRRNIIHSSEELLQQRQKDGKDKIGTLQADLKGNAGETCVSGHHVCELHHVCSGHRWTDLGI